MKIRGISAVAVVAFAAVFAAAAGKKEKKAEVIRPVEQAQWAAEPGMDGISKAELWGNAKKRHGGLAKFKGGTKVPLHTHSKDMTLVVVSGTIVHGYADGSTVTLGPGSYLKVNAGFPHTTACAEGADCVFYEEQPGEFDLKIVEAKKAN